MRWRPGVAVYWRGPGESQFGADGTLILGGLSRPEQELLDLLAASTHEPVEVVASRHGWSPGRLGDFLARLPPEVVIADEAPVGAAADAAVWSRWEMAGVSRPADRARAIVGVDGLDAVGLQVACLLAEAGVAEVQLTDRGVVLAGDVRPGGYRPGDLGRSRGAAAFDVLRARFPHLRLPRVAEYDDGGADLVVLVDHGVSDPLRYRRYLTRDQVHLPLVVRELDVAVGPLVRPGHGACLRCIDLVRTDADARWPAVATQLRARGALPREPISAAVAAGVAAHQALAYLDGRPTLTAGTMLLVDAIHPVPRCQTWPVHPECGCAPETLVPGAEPVQRGSV